MEMTKDLSPEAVERLAATLDSQEPVLFPARMDVAATARALSAALEAERAKTKDIDALQADREILHKAGIVEIAVRNPNVMEYIKHWESLAEAAEAERDALALQVQQARDDALEEAAQKVIADPFLVIEHLSRIAAAIRALRGATEGSR
jgi:hypothetical protein